MRGERGSLGLLNAGAGMIVEVRIVDRRLTLSSSEARRRLRSFWENSTRSNGMVVS